MYIDMTTQTQINPIENGLYPPTASVTVTPEHPRSLAAVDVLIVNPPLTDEALWDEQAAFSYQPLREQIAWTQAILPTLAALLHPHYRVEIIDAVAQGMDWAAFKAVLCEKQPRYYVTPLRETNTQTGIHGLLLARYLGMKTIAFGDFATKQAADLLKHDANLDYVLCGEPDLTLRELIDTLEWTADRWSTVAMSDTWPQVTQVFKAADPTWQPTWRKAASNENRLKEIQGLAWRKDETVVLNAERPSLSNLDSLPLPYHHLASLSENKPSTVDDNRACIFVNRGHTQETLRHRSPEQLMAELWFLHDLGKRRIQMVSDEFTADIAQIQALCQMIIAEELSVEWTCQLNIEQVDPAILPLMKRAGCQSIYWTLEAVSEQILNKDDHSYRFKKAPQILQAAKKAGLENRGCFTIGLPGETERTIKETIAFAKELPLDRLFFDLAPAYANQIDLISQTSQSASRFLTEATELNGVWRKLKQKSTEGNGHLSVADLQYWQKRAIREWTFTPKSMLNPFRPLKHWARFKLALSMGRPI